MEKAKQITKTKQNNRFVTHNIESAGNANIMPEMSATTNSKSRCTGILGRPRDRPVETAARRRMVHLGAPARGALPGPRSPSRSASAQGSRAPPTNGAAGVKSPAFPSAPKRPRACPEPGTRERGPEKGLPETGPRAEPPVPLSAARPLGPARPRQSAAAAWARRDAGRSTAEDDRPARHRRLPPTIPPLTPLTPSGSLAPGAALHRVRTAERLERAAAARRIRVRGHRK